MRAHVRYVFSDKRHQFHNSTPLARAKLLNGPPRLVAEDEHCVFAHIDEFQSFGTDAFASLLSEARKFAAHFCLANQYMDQLDASVQNAVLGNAGVLLVFRVSGRDAEILSSEFAPLPPSESDRPVGVARVEITDRMCPRRRNAIGYGLSESPCGSKTATPCAVTRSV
jgi:hypothetical protein